MVRFMLRRLLAMVLVLLAVSVVVFLIFNVIPNGDPAARMAGKQATATQVEAIRREWGFDEPIWVQYATTMRKVFTGDLISYTNRLDVDEEILRGLPATLSLAIGAAVIWMVLGVALGAFAALRAGRLADRAISVLALVGISLPVFWLGALMSHYLGFRAGIFPSGGYEPLTRDPLGWAYHLVLPWTALALLFVGLYSRVLRASVLDGLRQPYVETARAKGLSERRVLVGHVLRNSLIPIVSLWGLDFAVVLGGGAILTESVFDLDGVGQFAADAIAQLDAPPVLAVTLLGAFFVVLLGAVVDIVHAALDARVRVT